MKTAISLPDEVFAAAERLAAEMGLSRSRLYTKAVAEFVERHHADNVTAKLDQVYADVDSSLDPLLAQLQATSLAGEEW